MKTATRKEIRASVKASLNNVVSSLEIPTASKKTRKLIGKLSKIFSRELKAELKKQLKKTEKLSAPGMNGKASRAALIA